LDTQWGIIWAKICLALCGPAIVESSDEDFLQLLYDCVKAEDESSAYDVFDFLHDIGLSEEDVAAVHRYLVSNGHDEEPMLGFHQPQTCWYDHLEDGEALWDYKDDFGDFFREFNLTKEDYIWF
jgi:hypothetical protein